MESLCAGCKQNLPNTENIACCLCKYKYDLQCANIPASVFHSMTLENKNLWICQTCRCKIPKTGNVNTPIRQINPTVDKTPENNITMRKKPVNNFNNTTLSEDSSFLGDTICSEDKEKHTTANLSLQNLSEIIMQRLQENNKYIISEIKNTIEDEIKKAISKLKGEFEGRTNILFKQSDEKALEIDNINKKIEDLNKQNVILKDEIKQLKSMKITPEAEYTENKSKKIVIYGFTEYYKEPEYEVHNRLINMFYEILHVDLTGYIEETYRMGRNNVKNRPIVIELLSKKMTKYILENENYFQGTGLFVSEFLNENQRKYRNILREDMMKARKNGQYAIIRNNKLYIDGKYVPTNEETDLYADTYQNTTLANQPKERYIQTHSSNKYHNEDTQINYTFRNHRKTL